MLYSYPHPRTPVHLGCARVVEACFWARLENALAESYCDCVNNPQAA